MLPRLRFVFAAALIAGLPWILLGSGLMTTAQNTPVSEHPRTGTAVALAASDLRDAHHMHALAYVRRSRELERLRELASEPLSGWVAAPAGMTPIEPAPAPNDLPTQKEAIAAPDFVSKTPPEPAHEPTVVASLPLEPAASIEDPAVATPAAPAPEMVTAPPVAPTSSAQEELQTSKEVEPNLAFVDWSKVVPPLPRARVEEEHRKTTPRRKRAHAARVRSSQLQPDPFGGPPATATTENPGRTNGVSH